MKKTPAEVWPGRGGQHGSIGGRHHRPTDPEATLMQHNPLINTIVESEIRRDTTLIEEGNCLSPVASIM